LCGHQGGFFPDCIAEDGFDVLVAALVGLPVRVAERLRDRMDVELFDERLVGICFGG
jgi:hypothetical protein